MSYQDENQKDNKKKLFVGNLPFSMKKEDLEDLFSPFGELTDVHLVIDRMSGRSRGFAFVEFADEAAAQKALDETNGKKIDDRELVINFAKPKRPRQDRGGFRSDRRGGRDFGGDRHDSYNRDR